MLAGTAGFWGVKSLHLSCQDTLVGVKLSSVPDLVTHMITHTLKQLHTHKAALCVYCDFLTMHFSKPVLSKEHKIQFAIYLAFIQ